MKQKLEAWVWERRVKFLWESCERTAHLPFDVKILDDMIIEDERALAEAVKIGKERGELLRGK